MNRASRFLETLGSPRPTVLTPIGDALLEKRIQQVTELQRQVCVARSALEYTRDELTDHLATPVSHRVLAVVSDALADLDPLAIPHET